MKYKLYLSFYSPVHIGDGGELEPFEYIIKDNYLHTFSFEKFVSSLDPEDRQKLLNLQHDRKPSGLKDIRNFIRHRVKPEHFRDTIPVTPAVAYLYEEKFLDIRNMLKMEPFIKTMGTPYIPGSSLKGAIRTAVLNHWAQQGHRDEHDILKAKKKDRWGKLRSEISLDVFKFLKFPDIPLKNDFTLFSKIANFHIKDNELRETNIQLLREVTRSRSNPFKEFRHGDNRYAFDLQLDSEVMEDTKAVTGRRDLTFNVIWKSLDFYEGILGKEARKWSPHSNNLKKFYESFKENLKTRREKNDVKLLKIGFGSGFDAITVEKILRPGKSHGKSINLFEACSPLGWVMLYRD